jgi:hypothetical protein
MDDLRRDGRESKMAMGLGEEVEVADPEPEGPKNMIFRGRRAVWPTT